MLLQNCQVTSLLHKTKRIMVDLHKGDVKKAICPQTVYFIYNLFLCTCKYNLMSDWTTSKISNSIFYDIPLE